MSERFESVMHLIIITQQMLRPALMTRRHQDVFVTDRPEVWYSAVFAWLGSAYTLFVAGTGWLVLLHLAVELLTE